LRGRGEDERERPDRKTKGGKFGHRDKFRAPAKAKGNGKDKIKTEAIWAGQLKDNHNCTDKGKSKKKVLAKANAKDNSKTKTEATAILAKANANTMSTVQNGQYEWANGHQNFHTPAPG